MFGSDILEAAIGIVFVFVLVSTICCAVREAIEAWMKTRASYLEFAIRELLQDKKGTGLAKEFFEHPIIFGLYVGNYVPGQSVERTRPWRRGLNLPSYISAGSFALALLDLVVRDPHQANGIPRSSPGILTMQQVRFSIGRIQNQAVQRALTVAIDASHGSVDQLRANIEAWYDSTMDRVSGWYKRSTQWILFWIALLSAVGANISTITIADYLFRHDAERAAIVATVERTAAAPNASGESYNEAMQKLEDLHLPIGWTGAPGAPSFRGLRDSNDLWNDLFGPILGWLVTAFAATLGAPFWFDVLNKIMVIRSTVKPHEKSPEEGSEDRKEATRRDLSSTTLVSTEAAPAMPDVVEDHDDPCGVGDFGLTRDDQLPAAQGGVA